LTVQQNYFQTCIQQNFRSLSKIVLSVYQAQNCNWIPRNGRELRRIVVENFSTAITTLPDEVGHGDEIQASV